MIAGSATPANPGRSRVAVCAAVLLFAVIAALVIFPGFMMGFYCRCTGTAVEDQFGNPRARLYILFRPAGNLQVFSPAVTRFYNWQLTLTGAQIRSRNVICNPPQPLVNRTYGNIYAGFFYGTPPADNAACRTFFENMGVVFPPGASVRYAPATHRLIIRNQEMYLDVCDQIVAEYVADPSSWRGKSWSTPTTAPSP